MKVTAFTAVI